MVCRVEQAIQQGRLPTLAAELRAELASLSAADYSGHTLLQLKKQALVMDLLHYCQVVDMLVAENGGAGVGAVSDWTWQRQLRYYQVQVGAYSGRSLCLSMCPVLDMNIGVFR